MVPLASVSHPVPATVAKLPTALDTRTIQWYNALCDAFP